MINKEKILKEGEQISLKELFNLEEKNQDIERILVTILKDDDCQKGLVKITLKADNEITKVINKEYAFFFGGCGSSNTTVECYIEALEDSKMRISIELKEKKERYKND